MLGRVREWTNAPPPLHRTVPCGGQLIASHTMVLRPHPCRWRRARAAGVAILSACFPFRQSFAFVPCPRQAQHEHRRVSSCRISTSDSSPSTTTGARREQWREAVLPFLPPERFRTVSPADSLGRGEWFKLICGASFEVRAGLSTLRLLFACMFTTVAVKLHVGHARRKCSSTRKSTHALLPAVVLSWSDWGDRSYSSAAVRLLLSVCV